MTTHNQIIKKIAENHTDIDSAKITALFQEFMTEMQNCFFRNEKVIFHGNFTLYPAFKKSRSVFHNGQTFEIPDRWLINCKTSPVFRDKLTDTLNNSSHDDLL